MTQKYTKGPWKKICEDVDGPRELGDTGLRFWSIREATGERYRGGICIVSAAPHIGGISIEERNANAALISAAPDLLEAANYLLDDMRLHDVQTNCVQKLLRAIAKAEGKI